MSWDPIRSKVVTSAVFSRIFIITLSFVSNILIPNHDAGVFEWTATPPLVDQDGNSTTTLMDSAFGYLLDGLTRWDGQHFLHIVNNRYTYESSLAFFPLFPICVRILSEFIYWCQVDYGIFSFFTAIKISAVLLNFTLFIFTALTLYDLTRKVLKDEYLAYKASLLFCVNPASIFFSAAYSESLFAYLSFYTMLRLEKSFKIQMGILLSLSSAARSNGLINIFFAFYKSLKICAKEFAIHKQMGKYAELSTLITNIAGDAIVPALLSLLIGITPFALHQWYAFTHFCKLTKPVLDYSDDIIEYASLNGLKLPSDEPTSPWCRDIPPLSYNYIQSQYWNVGLFKYYQVRQIPNFMLGLPIILFLLWQGWTFVQHHTSYCVRLGLMNFEPTDNHNNLFIKVGPTETRLISL